jgi:hypothetical protein
MKKGPSRTLSELLPFQAKAKNRLDDFLQMDGGAVLLLKGPWGCGKSHYLRAYLRNEKLSKLWVPPEKKNAPRLYSYTSVFGLNSLQELTAAITASTQAPGMGIIKGDTIKKSAPVEYTGRTYSFY